MQSTFLRNGAILLAFGWIALSAPPALAHAIIVEATPSPDAVIHGASVAIKLRYNSRIDHARSRLILLDGVGNETPVPLAADNPTDQLAAEITGIAPGQYRLRWQVLALDGHITRGDIPFTIVTP